MSVAYGTERENSWGKKDNLKFKDNVGGISSASDSTQLLSLVILAFSKGWQGIQCNQIFFLWGEGTFLSL